MQKTAQEWFETIKDEQIKKRAIANINPFFSEELHGSLHNALGNAFIWAETPEKYDYWQNVSDELERESSKEEEAETIEKKMVVTFEFREKGLDVRFEYFGKLNSLEIMGALEHCRQAYYNDHFAQTEKIIEKR